MYEQDLTASYINKQFTAVKPHIITLIKRIRDSKTFQETKSINKYFNGSKQYKTRDQKKLVQFILHLMQFDFQNGRIDVSAHPFTTALGVNDVRITNKYKKDDFRDSLSSSMHEAGHALYEQNINPLYKGTPLEGGVSLGIHEAMSRFYENQIGRNTEFLSYLTPLLQAVYPSELLDLDPQTVTLLFNLVKPGNIRIEADEVTYTMHIILRFELENDLINGTLSVSDAPDAWNYKMKQYLGIEPPTDTEGILQDVHWAYGSFGYFPSYALGNLYASQFYKVMNKDFNISSELKHGNLPIVSQWLKKHVYQFGSLYLPKDLIRKVSGEKLNAEYFIEYLNEKYTGIYKLK